MTLATGWWQMQPAKERFQPFLDEVTKLDLTLPLGGSRGTSGEGNKLTCAGPPGLEQVASNLG
jgi:hypothetical protein